MIENRVLKYFNIYYDFVYQERYTAISYRIWGLVELHCIQFLNQFNFLLLCYCKFQSNNLDGIGLRFCWKLRTKFCSFVEEIFFRVIDEEYFKFNERIARKFLFFFVKKFDLLSRIGVVQNISYLFSKDCIFHDYLLKLRWLKTCKN